jgi:hypothetical protein
MRGQLLVGKTYQIWTDQYAKIVSYEMNGMVSALLLTVEKPGKRWHIEKRTLPESFFDPEMPDSYHEVDELSWEALTFDISAIVSPGGKK